MNRLLSASRLGRHESGCVFHRETDGPAETFLIVSGEVIAARALPEGRRLFLVFLGAGAIVGTLQPFGDLKRAAYDCSAHSEVLAVHMPTSLLFEMLDSEPMLWKYMALTVLSQNAHAVRSIQSHIHGSLQQRLASTIERLSGLYGTDMGGGAGIRLKISRTNLAMLLQANRKVVNKVLKTMESEGAIHLEHSALVVRNAKALRHVASGLSRRDGGLRLTD